MSAILKAFTFGKSKHKKLPEEWGETIKEAVKEGITFHCKYLGSTLVAQASDEVTTAEAIKTIIAMAKLSNKEQRKVAMTIRPNGIVTRDLITNEKCLDVSIYRISYCSADANYDKVVAFIATNKNETFECHAFQTKKNEMAVACALTISHAFNIAYDQYQNSQSKKEESNQENSGERLNNDEKINNEKNSFEHTNGKVTIDLLSDEVTMPSETEFDFHTADSFLKLAETRAKMSKKPEPLLPTNLNFNNFGDMNKFIKEEAQKSQMDKFTTDLLSL